MANRAPKQLSLPHILWEVFRRPGYIILILVVILGILVFAAWLPNLHFLGQTLFTGRYSVGARAIILLNTFNLLQSNLSVVTLSLTVLIAFLTAVNIAEGDLQTGGTSRLTGAGALQNIASLAFLDSGFSGTLDVATLDSNNTYLLPDIDDADLTDTVCLFELANCAGGNVTTSGGANTNRLAKFTTGTNIEESDISETGGLVFLVRDGETGFHVPTGDPEALADRLRQLLQDEILRQRLGQQAAEYAKRYAWPLIADQIIDLYHGTTGIHA